MHERGYLTQTIEPIIDLFIQHLTTCSFENFKRLPSFEIWKNKRFEVDPLLRNLAIEVLTIPSSETAVKRLFRYLSGATQINLKNQLPDIINARLTVKFDSLFGHAGAVPFHLLATPENDLKGVFMSPSRTQKAKLVKKYLNGIECICHFMVDFMFICLQITCSL